MNRGRMALWVGVLIAALFIGSGWLRSGSPLSELDILTSAGNALQGHVPSDYFFESSVTDKQRVRVNDKVVTSLKVNMVYKDPESGVEQVYTIYLQPETADVLGYGAVETLSR